MRRWALISREFTFEASHHLPGHNGKCRRPHGHSYRLEIALRGAIKEQPGASDDGMVMDFEDLKQIVNESIIEKIGEEVPRGPLAQPIEQGGIDHNNLNDVTGIRTTAENLVHWIWDALVASGIKETLLYRVRLWETSKSYAEITQDERN